VIGVATAAVQSVVFTQRRRVDILLVVTLIDDVMVYAPHLTATQVQVRSQPAGK